MKLFLESVHTTIDVRNREICVSYNFIDKEGHYFVRTDYNPLSSETVSKAFTEVTPGQFTQLKNTGLLDPQIYKFAETIANETKQD